MDATTDNKIEHRKGQNMGAEVKLPWNKGKIAIVAFRWGSILMLGYIGWNARTNVSRTEYDAKWTSHDVERTLIISGIESETKHTREIIDSATKEIRQRLERIERKLDRVAFFDRVEPELNGGTINGVKGKL